MSPERITALVVASWTELRRIMGEDWLAARPEGLDLKLVEVTGLPYVVFRWGEIACTVDLVEDLVYEAREGLVAVWRRPPGGEREAVAGLGDADLVAALAEPA